MVTWIPSIYPQCPLYVSVYIPAPWILWVLTDLFWWLYGLSDFEMPYSSNVAVWKESKSEILWQRMGTATFHFIWIRILYIWYMGYIMIYIIYIYMLYFMWASHMLAMTHCGSCDKHVATITCCRPTHCGACGLSARTLFTMHPSRRSPIKEIISVTFWLGARI
jgi:hypothetical protein